MTHGSTSKILSHVRKCPRLLDIYKHIHQNLQNLTKNAFYHYLFLSFSDKTHFLTGFEGWLLLQIYNKRLKKSIHHAQCARTVAEGRGW